jgi:hypothetical protein
VEEWSQTQLYPADSCLLEAVPEAKQNSNTPIRVEAYAFPFVPAVF